MSSVSAISVRCLRTAARKVEKIPVQLLKDYQPLGVAGEIVKVRPGFMRNFLHADNKACYITKDQGPRIPVVKASSRKLVAPKKKKVSTSQKAEAKESSPALSFNELANLFSNSRSKGTEEAPSFTAEPASTLYTLADLDEGLPSTFTISGQDFPISKETLVQSVFNATGIELPASAIKVKAENGDVLPEIAASGDYTWSFSVPGQTSTLQKRLRVQ